MSFGKTAGRQSSFIRLGLILYFVICVIAVTANVLKHHRYEVYSKRIFFTFHESFYHLIHHQPMYPGVTAEAFKYSPTFALFFAPYAVVPAPVGMYAWNMTAVIVLVWAMWMLPIRSIDRLLILFLGLQDLFCSLWDWQTNTMVIAAIVGTVYFLERGWLIAAACCVVAGFNIKIYGGLGAIFFLFYPRKIQFLFVAAATETVAALLPLVAVSARELWDYYIAWFALIHENATYLIKLSVMGLFAVVTGIKPPVEICEAVGLLLVFLPLARTRLYSQQLYRLRMLSSVLLGVIIFNHMADRPSFIIPLVGAGLWYVLSPRKWPHHVIILLVFASGFRPLLSPIEIKVVPYFLAWLVLQWELWRQKETDPLPVSEAQ